MKNSGSMYPSFSPLLLTLLLCFHARVCHGGDGEFHGDDQFFGDDEFVPPELGDHDMFDLGNLFGGLDLDLSAKETSCMNATMTLITNSKTLQDAMIAFTMTMDLPLDEEDQDDAEITMSYPHDAVDSFATVCEQEGGVLLVIKEGDYDCTAFGDSIRLVIRNMAQCVAAVDDCGGFHQEIMLVQTMDQLGIDCEIGNEDEDDQFVGDDPQILGEILGDDQQFFGDDEFIVGDDQIIGDDYDFFSEADDDMLSSLQLGDEDDMFDLGNPFGGLDLDLSEKETSCMNATTTLAMNSKALQDAMIAYTMAMDLPSDDELQDQQDDAEMTMSYPQDAVDSFATVCEQEGGVLLVIKEGNYDCTAFGDSIRLVLQNMAQCVASVVDCGGFHQDKLVVQTMDLLGIDCEIGNEEEAPAPANNAAPSTKNISPIVMAVGIGGVLVTACADCLPQSDA